MNTIKRIVASVGVVLVIIGMSGFDSNISVSVLFILAGALLMIPFYQKEKEFEERRKSYNDKYHRDFVWDKDRRIG